MSKPIWQQLKDLSALAGRHANKHYVLPIRRPAETLYRRLAEAGTTAQHYIPGTSRSLHIADNLLELVPVAKRLTKFTGIPQVSKRGRIIAAGLERIAAEFLLQGIEYGNITLAQEPQS